MIGVVTVHHADRVQAAVRSDEAASIGAGRVLAALVGAASTHPAARKPPQRVSETELDQAQGVLAADLGCAGEPRPTFSGGRRRRLLCPARRS